MDKIVKWSIRVVMVIIWFAGVCCCFALHFILTNEDPREDNPSLVIDYENSVEIPEAKTDSPRDLFEDLALVKKQREDERKEKQRAEEAEKRARFIRSMVAITAVLTVGPLIFLTYDLIRSIRRRRAENSETKVDLKPVGVGVGANLPKIPVRKSILCIASLMLAGNLIYPPWYEVSTKNAHYFRGKVIPKQKAEVHIGRRFVWSPPAKSKDYEYSYEYHVWWGGLMLQITPILIVFGVALILMDRKKS